MSNVELKNGYIMMRELKRTENEKQTAAGLFIPEEVLEDEQVSQGTVVRSNSDEYKIGEILFFHRVMPVDVTMKLDNDDKLEQYFFITDKDVICKII